jgi:hypothetical protein
MAFANSVLLAMSRDCAARLSVSLAQSLAYS